MSSVKELSLVASSAPTAPASGMILMNEYYETCCVQEGTVYAARFIKLIHYSLWRGRILSYKLFSWLERRTRMHRLMLPSQVCTNVCFPHTYAPTYAALTSMHQRMLPPHVCTNVCCRMYAPTYAALTRMQRRMLPSHACTNACCPHTNYFFIARNVQSRNQGILNK